MGRLTTHVLDTAAGIPAAGMRVALHRTGPSRDARLSEFRTTIDGRAPAPLLADDTLIAGKYELHFHVAEYFRARGVALPEPPFLDVVVIAFGVADVEQPYHVPLLV
jgi:5-hydroxyisourate hydrolase